MTVERLQIPTQNPFQCIALTEAVTRFIAQQGSLYVTTSIQLDEAESTRPGAELYYRRSHTRVHPATLADGAGDPEGRAKLKAYRENLRVFAADKGSFANSG